MLRSSYTCSCASAHLFFSALVSSGGSLEKVPTYMIEVLLGVGEDEKETVRTNYFVKR